MGFLENIRVALSAVRSNLLRSILTVMIIAVVFDYPGTVSIYMTGTGTATVKHENEKTNPNIRLTGIDENYLNLRGLELETGRALSFNEIQNGNNRAIIGKDIVDLLFKGKSDQALGKVISVGNIKYGQLPERKYGHLAYGGHHHWLNHAHWCRHRTDEHHAGFGDRTYSRNWHHQSSGRYPPKHLDTIPHRSHRHLPDRWGHRHYPRHFNGEYCHLFFRRKFLDALALDRRRRGDLYDRRFIFGIISGLEGF